MRIFLITFLVIILAPFAASASVQVYTTSSSNTGGIVATGGERVTSDSGSASASVYTNISSTESGGTVDITVKTEKNGVEQTETKHVDVAAGENVQVSVGTSSGTGASASVVAPVPRSSSEQENHESNQDAEASASVAATNTPETSVAAATSNDFGLLAAVESSVRIFADGWIAGLYQNVRSFVSGIFAAFGFSS